MYVLSHGCLLSSYKAFFNLHTWLFLSCASNPTGCKFLFIVYSFFLWEASCYESWLVSHDVSIYCILDLADPLRTSLQVSILHPRHHSSWTGTLLPFLLGYFFISWKALQQWCRSTVSHNYTVCKTSWILWKYHHINLYLGLFLEPSSLVLRNKSHPSFLVGDYTWSFLQVKCTSCMIRNISQCIFIMVNSYA